jgi:hypothetical protein
VRDVRCTTDEFRELCEIAADVPKLWNDPAVENVERKELLRCLISNVVIDATGQRIDLKVNWTSGEQSSFYLWRTACMHHLVEELYAEGLTA